MPWLGDNRTGNPDAGIQKKPMTCVCGPWAEKNKSLNGGGGGT